MRRWVSPMNSIIRSPILAVLVAFGISTRANENQIPIYDDASPGSEARTRKEIEYLEGGKMMIRNVTIPTLTPYLPTAEAATGAAVVVCPGGGFRFLSWQSEGTELAEWLKKRGVAAFVLKYRLKETAASPDEFRKEMGKFFLNLIQFKDRDLSSDAAKQLSDDMRESAAPGIADGRQAVRMVRQNSEKWGIRKDRIGLIGFSAGAIITRSVASDFEAQSRPDFVAHIYGPVFEAITVPPDAPPLFILAAADDAVSEASSGRLYEMWRAAGRQAELHIYERGGHGFGMSRKGLPVDGWIERYGDWLSQRGLVRPNQGN